MYAIKSPIQKDILIPETPAENDQTFALNQLGEMARYYCENGYAVIKGAVDPGVCDSIRGAFEQNIKAYPKYIYRQATANPERNVFGPSGFVMNPIVNLQSLDSKSFLPIKSQALKVFASKNIVAVCQAIFSEQPKCVQSMYFEGNSETWPHQDTYYLDSENIGTMVGIWYALEDIDAGAGRFFVVPGSHNIDMAKNGKDFDVAFNHGRYKELVRKILSENNYELRAPYLAKGDILIWNAKTVHGSLRTTRPQRSRSSLTAHYIPSSHRFLQFQSRIKNLNLKSFEGMQFHCHKDMDRLSNKVLMKVETTFPAVFQSVKKLAIKSIVK
jgi:phytanoyl-CoA hydroxylase